MKNFHNVHAQKKTKQNNKAILTPNFQTSPLENDIHWEKRRPLFFNEVTT
jgi:hypothetical protein